MSVAKRKLIQSIRKAFAALLRCSRVVKYYQQELAVGMAVKLSDDLVKSAREEAASTDRSITGQIEHWAKIGRSVEAVLRHQDVQALKRSPAEAALTVPARRAVKTVLAVANKTKSTLASRLKAGRVVYQSDPEGSGLTERVEPNGTRTLGRLVNRRFVPAPASRSRGR